MRTEQAGGSGRPDDPFESERVEPGEERNRRLVGAGFNGVDEVEVEGGFLGQAVEEDRVRAADAVPAEEMESFGAQQELLLAVEEPASSARNRSCTRYQIMLA